MVMALHPGVYRLYQVWDCTADVMVPGPRFRSAEDAIAFADAQPTVHAIQCPDGTWLKPPPPVEPEPEPERRQSRRIPVLAPGRLELTPGRVNASARRVLPVVIVDAAEAGLRLRVNGALPGNGSRVYRQDLVRVLFNAARASVEVPARVVWLAEGSLGVHFKLVDRQLRGVYTQWLRGVTTTSDAPE